MHVFMSTFTLCGIEPECVIHPGILSWAHNHLILLQTRSPLSVFFLL